MIWSMSIRIVKNIKILEALDVCTNWDQLWPSYINKIDGAYDRQL